MAGSESLDWNLVVERHAERVFRVALRIVGSVQAAEDVSQDAFIEAFQLHQRSTVQNWEGLLVRLATLRALDRLRRCRPTVELREYDRMSTVEPFEEVVAAELVDWMRASIAQLPEQQATVFAMVYFERLSRNEIAAALGVSPESVSTALYKARQRLLAQLAVFNRGDSK